MSENKPIDTELKAMQAWASLVDQGNAPKHTADAKPVRDPSGHDVIVPK